MDEVFFLNDGTALHGERDVLEWLKSVGIEHEGDVSALSDVLLGALHEKDDVLYKCDAANQEKEAYEAMLESVQSAALELCNVVEDCISRLLRGSAGGTKAKIADILSRAVAQYQKDSY